jgi:hypothetical protein
MNGINHDDISIWVDDLSQLKPEFTIIPVWNTIQFFKIQGRKSVIAKENMEPIKDVWYSVKGKDKFYLKRFRNHSVDEMYFYRRTETFSGESTDIENLRRYIYDRNLSLILTKQQFNDIDEALVRLWKGRYVSPGKVKYKHYIALLHEHLQLEDYKTYSSGLMGSKTVVMQYEGRIKKIWDEIYGIEGT